MALILTIDRASMPDSWCSQYAILWFDKQIKIILDTIDYHWSERSVAEENEECKQLIPYILVTWNGKLANYCRAGNEKRLNGLRSLGIGGHIDTCDQENAENLTQIIINGAVRELYEEFGINCKNPVDFQWLGIINEEDSKAGRVHTGIVILYNADTLPIPGEELTDLIWTAPAQINEKGFEFWSVMALELYRSSIDALSTTE